MRLVEPQEFPDAVDLRIMALIFNGPKARVRGMAREIGLSKTAIMFRLQKLEKAYLIVLPGMHSRKGYHLTGAGETYMKSRGLI